MTTEKGKITLLLTIEGPHAEALANAPFLLRALARTVQFAMWGVACALGGCWADYSVSIVPEGTPGGGDDGYAA